MSGSRKPDNDKNPKKPGLFSRMFGGTRDAQGGSPPAQPTPPNPGTTGTQATVSGTAPGVTRARPTGNRVAALSGMSPNTGTLRGTAGEADMTPVTPRSPSAASEYASTGDLLRATQERADGEYGAAPRQYGHTGSLLDVGSAYGTVPGAAPQAPQTGPISRRSGEPEVPVATADQLAHNQRNQGQGQGQGQGQAQEPESPSATSTSKRSP